MDLRGLDNVHSRQSSYGEGDAKATMEKIVVLFSQLGSKVGFSDLVVVNGVKVSEVVRSGVNFKSVDQIVDQEGRAKSPDWLIPENRIGSRTCNSSSIATHNQRVIAQCSFCSDLV
ncbi:hypothetical protein TIFTF001_037612 [Ficus carica]|uniref:Uncharacterized protein n=1 Tax=Ficus carica TaxID=3494 RepID=A0AA88E6C8_FICCA|nr:hypothetical protein TIFTF001_037604 [Ficus carica]GMN68558.1 hypothetical protein TIFTF001_037612 [Ficus carica]